MKSQTARNISLKDRLCRSYKIEITVEDSFFSLSSKCPSAVVYLSIKDRGITVPPDVAQGTPQVRGFLYT